MARERIIDGRYRLGRQLGEGAMGTVWEALDLRLERQVAVKVVGSSAVGRDPRARERFEREAKLLAGLSSPFIVTVHDVGETDFGDGDLGQSVLYLVMERLHGRSLEAVLATELPPLAEVARWGEQVCRALAVAHDSGVVHRDLKPANVMVGPDGLARVLDFGIAAVLAESTDHARLTSTGVVVGTPSYMSPEQIEGGSVGFRSDLYSAGCVLYALVTGQPPFSGPSLYQLLRQQMESDPQPPGERRAGVPAAWDQLILALLQKRPEARPGSATEVADRLRELSLSAAAATVLLPAQPVVAPAVYEPTRVDPRSVLLASCPHPDGGRLPLATGQRMRLSDVLPLAEAFTVAVDWRADEGMDVDASALVLDAGGRVLSDEHFVFYNNPEPAGVGVTLAGEDPEALFTVRLPELGEEARRVVFALSLHEEGPGGGRDLAAVGRPHLRLRDAENGAELLCYGFPDGPPGVTGVTVGELVRDDDGWLFSANSRGFPDGLAEIAESYGVLVEAEA
ncbi:serine/threonine protein kinase [Streptomyces zhaozhouensis]|uniref:non-specific serine/threonine protein kinase n=1 Tax=Streptomyces zhaozhouensis TaxID=1300267 RepID=A0A286E4Y4_9ACTN|nr:TerD family protein [Streptomyces zhaozhouensis]SOD65934.1 serine/threonine protein kinase [Streptomyces zhaozhouensis]